VEYRKIVEEKNIVEGEEKTKLEARIKFATLEFVNEDILKVSYVLSCIYQIKVRLD